MPDVDLAVRARHADETHARRASASARERWITRCPRSRAIASSGLPADRRGQPMTTAVGSTWRHQTDDPHAYRTQMIEDSGILTIRPQPSRHARPTAPRRRSFPRRRLNQMETTSQRRLTHGRPPSPVPMPDCQREPRPHAPATARQSHLPPDVDPSSGKTLLRTVGGETLT